VYASGTLAIDRTSILGAVARHDPLELDQLHVATRYQPPFGPNRIQLLEPQQELELAVPHPDGPERFAIQLGTQREPPASEANGQSRQRDADPLADFVAETTIPVERRRFGFYAAFRDTSGFFRSQLSSRWSFTAAGAHVVFGYRSRSDHPGWRVWNGLGLELGVLVNQLNFDPDETFEVGFGFAVTIANGWLTVGVGRNISTDLGHPNYTFVGTSISKIVKAFTPKKAKTTE
jgi:hypothetical protein